MCDPAQVNQYVWGDVSSSFSPEKSLALFARELRCLGLLVLSWVFTLYDRIWALSQFSVGCHWTRSSILKGTDILVRELFLYKFPAFFDKYDSREAPKRFLCIALTDWMAVISVVVLFHRWRRGTNYPMVHVQILPQPPQVHEIHQVSRPLHLSNERADLTTS